MMSLLLLLSLQCYVVCVQDGRTPSSGDEVILLQFRLSLTIAIKLYCCRLWIVVNQTLMSDELPGFGLLVSCWKRFQSKIIPSAIVKYLKNFQWRFGNSHCMIIFTQTHFSLTFLYIYADAFHETKPAIWVCSFFLWSPSPRPVSGKPQIFSSRIYSRVGLIYIIRYILSIYIRYFC